MLTTSNQLGSEDGKALAIALCKNTALTSLNLASGVFVWKISQVRMIKKLFGWKIVACSDFAIVKSSIIDEVEVDKWISGFLDLVVNICIKLHNDEYLEKFEWENVKNEYNCADNKKEYIKNLASWVGQKAATIAKKCNCSIGNVNSKRAAYFLLRNYLIKEDSQEKNILKIL
ncbi:hypothetical protein C2G38_2168413 [Gigaspora rosea]|uniref:Uncharacterized protein n=1 Tax=Gigaspora rosea TaxID=44941 RepID=A0A397VPV5_9GLOM|nr:hypothetical protein C2G38_2168413 [Gigaspora rosea]